MLPVHAGKSKLVFVTLGVICHEKYYKLSPNAGLIIRVKVVGT
jgi:hypothetical protein